MYSGSSLGQPPPRRHKRRRRLAAPPVSGPAAPGAAPEDLEAVQLAAAPAEALQRLDEVLAQAIQQFGWPLWFSPGQGSGEPNRPQHDFSFNSLSQGARIDFYRGVVADDWLNTKWKALYQRLPRYRATITKQWNVSSVITEGNAMEVATGIAYAAHTRAEHLPQGHELHFPAGGDAAWARVWECLTAVGVVATPQAVPPVPGPAAPAASAVSVASVQPVPKLLARQAIRVQPVPKQRGKPKDRQC